MIRFIILNEISVFQAVVFMLIGRRVCILDTCSYMKLFDFVLRKAERILLRWKPGASVENILKDMPWYEGQPVNTIHTPIMTAIIENLYTPLQSVFVGEHLKTYGYAYKKALTDYSARLLPSLTIINWLEATHPNQKFQVIGAPTHFSQMYRLYHGAEPGFVCRAVNPVFIANLVNAISVWLWIMIGLISKTRPFTSPHKRFVLGLDSQAGREEETIAVTVLNNPSEEALIVNRNAEAKRNSAKIISSNISQRLISDARIPFFKSLELGLRASRELIAIWRNYRTFDAQLFVRFCILSANSANFAAFFWKYPVAYFWGRDEYSMAHIVRNNEVRNIGGKSLGMLHGIPARTYYHSWGEVDFDICFVPCMALYHKCYKNFWPTHMEVLPIGNRFIMPDQQQDCAPTPSNSIVYFPIVHTKFEEIACEIIKIAKHFSDRTLYVKFKHNRPKRHKIEYKEFEKRFPENVISVNSNDEPYDLLQKCQYVITAGSTLGVEAIQFRRVSFVFDVDPELDNFFFRNIPECIVKNAEDVIGKIEDIESGRQQYPFQRISEDIGINKENFYETLRQKIIPEKPVGIAS